MKKNINYLYEIRGVKKNIYFLIIVYIYNSARKLSNHNSFSLVQGDYKVSS